MLRTFNATHERQSLDWNWKDASCLPRGFSCYSSVFPWQFPETCTDGHRCLSSVATARRGALQITMYEKSCAAPSQCGVSGQKYASGLFFNFSNVCCDDDLCNGASSLSTAKWGGAALCLPLVLGLLLA
ncbi:sperm acrosome membrane-associated protein 4-like isoform X1 [Syngnathoides biaculeatus]|uniref:sperm acrosome membrane-associated protein 4-like isoform X1 n=1 Tax=Syngnathoides biaculeatus TaxID=300417 RepID=UPI002ADE4FC0|nr:sperm acrosome membrane-associated protein 4-like isoform X1 [Syngnathoides biaculeatus]